MSALKLLKNDSDQQKAALLFDLIEQRKEMEKKEKELKDYFRSVLSADQINVVHVGGYIVSVADRVTTTIDRKLMAEILGDDEVRKYEKKTPYQILDIKIIK